MYEHPTGVSSNKIRMATSEQQTKISNLCRQIRKRTSEMKLPAPPLESESQTQWKSLTDFIEKETRFKEVIDNSYRSLPKLNRKQLLATWMLFDDHYSRMINASDLEQTLSQRNIVTLINARQAYFKVKRVLYKYIGALRSYDHLDILSFNFPKGTSGGGAPTGCKGDGDECDDDGDSKRPSFFISWLKSAKEKAKQAVHKTISSDQKSRNAIGKSMAMGIASLALFTLIHSSPYNFIETGVSQVASVPVYNVSHTTPSLKDQAKGIREYMNSTLTDLAQEGVQLPSEQPTEQPTENSLTEKASLEEEFMQSNNKVVGSGFNVTRDEAIEILSTGKASSKASSDTQSSSKSVQWSDGFRFPTNRTSVSKVYIGNKSSIVGALHSYYPTLQQQYGKEELQISCVTDFSYPVNGNVMKSNSTRYIGKFASFTPPSSPETTINVIIVGVDMSDSSCRDQAADFLNRVEDFDGTNAVVVLGYKATAKNATQMNGLLKKNLNKAAQPKQDQKAASTAVSTFTEKGIMDSIKKGMSKKTASTAVSTFTEEGIMDSFFRNSTMYFDDIDKESVYLIRVPANTRNDVPEIDRDGNTLRFVHVDTNTTYEDVKTEIVKIFKLMETLDNVRVALLVRSDVPMEKWKDTLELLDRNVIAFDFDNTTDNLEFKSDDYRNLIGAIRLEITNGHPYFLKTFNLKQTEKDKVFVPLNKIQFHDGPTEYIESDDNPLMENIILLTRDSSSAYTHTVQAGASRAYRLWIQAIAAGQDGIEIPNNVIVIPTQKTYWSSPESTAKGVRTGITNVGNRLMQSKTDNRELLSVGVLGNVVERGLNFVFDSVFPKGATPNSIPSSTDVATPNPNPSSTDVATPKPNSNPFSENLPGGESPVLYPNPNPNKVISHGGKSFVAKRLSSQYFKPGQARKTLSFGD